MQWTLKNNIKAISDGLIVWAQQGTYFCCTKTSPKFALEHDDCSLIFLFGSSIQEESVPQVFIKINEAHSHKITAKYLKLQNEIINQIEKIGSEFNTSTSSNLDLECEREKLKKRKYWKSNLRSNKRAVPLTGIILFCLTQYQLIRFQKVQNAWS
jgi:hypothetical protein